MTRRCAVVIALWLGTGCGNPSKPAPAGSPPSAPPADAQPADAQPIDRDYARLTERAVELYEAVAEAFRAAGTDCARATARLGELSVTYKDVVTANAKILHEGRARELKQALAKHSDRFDAAAKAIMESRAMAECYKDAAFTQAFDDLVAAPP
ncbi:MAG TPA: hypothetical protein VNO30_02155 [Kofleriaceae bacterium]|nr:hypothetical protein [Kofleriaceae bacterium]